MIVERGKSYYPLDTGRKLNARKMFRRRPGNLLKVLLYQGNSKKFGLPYYLV